jgi:hypothetical protein
VGYRYEDFDAEGSWRQGQRLRELGDVNRDRLKGSGMASGWFYRGEHTDRIPGVGLSKQERLRHL